MEVIRTAAQLGEALAARADDCVGFVPTMGALHEGHISLVGMARRENDAVVVSVFVNPTQFNDPDDLRNYPRTPDKDIRMLEEAGADIVFMPPVEEIYPEPDTRVFDFGTIDKAMEGATRPGHFNGVAQVVSRLFDLVKPRRAYFGGKDFQQVAVVRELVRRTEQGVEIVECPIVRETDGLAMSSRNALLTPAHRTAAPRIYEALRRGADAAGRIGVEDVRKSVAGAVNADPLLKVIYFELVDAADLRPVARWEDAERIQGCIAVQAGRVRLIDNMRFK